jgi:hypothetical protein
LHATGLACQTSPLPKPKESEPEQSQKINDIVKTIATLNLSEVAELIKALKVGVDLGGSLQR